MKHFFFVFLFALAALFFTACSSSDENDNGGIPAVPDPKSVNGFPGGYQSASRTKTYPAAGQGAFDAYKAAWEERGDVWTCDAAIGRCVAAVSVGGVPYDFKAYMFIDSLGSYYIALSIHRASTATLPSGSIFESSLPPVADEASKNGYGFSLVFADAQARDTYKTAYIAALTNNTFTLQGSSYYKDLDGTYLSVGLGEDTSVDDEGITSYLLLIDVEASE
jgi:hypothetical protein